MSLGSSNGRKQLTSTNKGDPRSQPASSRYHLCSPKCTLLLSIGRCSTNQQVTYCDMLQWFVVCSTVMLDWWAAAV
jgi:hypothetical protein